jgi:hypothetical protein
VGISLKRRDIPEIMESFGIKIAKWFRLKKIYVFIKW